MYPLGIDDRLKKTPIVESLVLPHPLYQGDRLSSPTSIGLCITHPSLNKALGSRFLAPKSVSRPQVGTTGPSGTTGPQLVLPLMVVPACTSWVTAHVSPYLPIR